MKESIIDFWNARESIHTPSSLVNVYFEDLDLHRICINEGFDLQPADIVYTDGVYAGHRGRVDRILYDKRLLSASCDRITARVDHSVNGKMSIIDGNLVTTSPEIIPFEKILAWFIPPTVRHEKLTSDESFHSFRIDEIGDLVLPRVTGEKTIHLVKSRSVIYVELNGGNVCAIVRDGCEYHKLLQPSMIVQSEIKTCSTTPW